MQDGQCTRRSKTMKAIILSCEFRHLLLLMEWMRVHWQAFTPLPAYFLFLILGYEMPHERCAGQAIAGNVVAVVRGLGCE